jgi:hypothetical protein
MFQIGEFRYVVWFTVHMGDSTCTLRNEDWFDNVTLAQCTVFSRSNLRDFVYFHLDADEAVTYSVAFFDTTRSGTS